MKKLLLLAAFVSLTQLGIAQERSYEQKAAYLIQLTAGQTFDMMIKPITQMIPENNRAAFLQELDGKVTALYMNMGSIYMESFSEEELDELLAFYNSPIGKKMVEVTPEIMQKGMELGQQWAMEIQPLIAKYNQ